MKIILSMLLTCLLITSCLNDVEITLKRKAQTISPTPSPTPTPPLAVLIWNYSSLVILPGEEVPFQLTNGVPPYVTDTQGIGTFDATTLIFTAPVNQVPTNHTIGATDFDTKTGTNSFKISSFLKGSAIAFPLTFGDQNYVSGATVTANGNMFISSIISDSPGWERWVIYKSTDIGATWSEVDQYVPYEEGESHPLAITSKNNDVYTCGYEYDSAVFNTSTWIVRKSTDAGMTWSNVDQYLATPAHDHVCYDITVDPNTGHLFASGYASDALGRSAVVRESADNGATWTTIRTDLGGVYFSIKVSPNGTLWAMKENGELHKATFSLGSWNWSTAGTLTPAGDASGFYELRGRLLILDDNNAYYSFTNSVWQINKTIDGGATWTSSYAGAANSVGRDILQAANGDLISVGQFAPLPYSFTILKSSDNGSTWNSVYSNNTVSKYGKVLVKANDNSILAFGNEDNDSYQILSVRSTDNGDNWSARAKIYFKQGLYTELNDFQIDANGVMWSTAWLNYYDDNLVSPWGLIKSSDNALTWTNSDVFTTVGDSQTADTIAFGPNDEIYVSGRNNTNVVKIRKSTDNGAIWNEVDSHIPAGSTWASNVKTAVLPNGDVFYAANANVGATDFVELHRGATNGTVWSTLATFPIQPGSTNFNLLGLKTFSDGSLWLYGNEENSSAQRQCVVYRSTDSGTSFVEKFREDATNPGSTVYNIERASNGDYYISANENILKSSDNGTTWTNFYLGSTLGNAEKFALDSNDKIFILNQNDQIITQNQFTNTFFITYDFTLDNNYYNRELIDIKRCGNLSSVCAIGRYSKSIVGEYFMLIPLLIP